MVDTSIKMMQQHISNPAFFSVSSASNTTVGGQLLHKAGDLTWCKLV